MRLRLTATAAAVLLLAGCSDLEPGSPLPTGGRAGLSPPDASASASATPTSGGTGESPTPPTVEPTATPVPPPTLPPEATTNDAAGAEAFVRYWLETVNHAYGTGSLEPMLAISSPECEACASIAEEVQGYRDDGLTFVDGHIEPREVISPAPDGTGVGLVAVAYEQEASQVVDEQGESVATSAPRQVSIDAVIRREGEAWTLYDLGR